MADSASVRAAMNALIRENWGTTVTDTTFDIMRMVKLVFGRNGTKNGFKGLGIPNVPAFAAGPKQAQMRKQEILSSTIYQPLTKIGLPDDADGKALVGEDNNPTKTGWENKGPEKRVKRMSVKWFMSSDPAKVSNERIEETAAAAKGESNGWEAIGSLLKMERDDVLGIHLRRINKLLWGTYAGSAKGIGTGGRPTDEDAEFWDAPYSVPNALAATGTYCGIDRNLAANAGYRGNTVSAATSAVFKDLIRYAVLTMPISNFDGTTSKGLMSKGMDLPFLITGNDLFATALAEAEAKQGSVIAANTPIPEMGGFGFKTKVVQIDNTIIVPDPECPAGMVLGLNPDAWTVAVHPKHNFRQTEPTNQENIEGGDRATTWVIDSKWLIVCEAPNVGGVVWTAVS